MAQLTKKTTAIRKQQKIQQSNKTMFIWIALMSAVVGVCLIVSWFLYQQLAFKTMVVNAKKDTLTALENNVENADELVANVRKFETDKSLNSLKADPEDRALQVILDALPTTDNRYALGASIQKRLADNLEGVGVERLTVGDEVLSSDLSTGKIPFKLIVNSADASKLQELLLRFEQSIRTINVVSVSLERPSDDKLTLTIEGEAFYEPETTIELGKETIKP